MMNRRQFVYATAASALGLVTFARGSEQQLAADYDLIVKGGRVIDPSLRLNAIRDVAITAGSRAASLFDSDHVRERFRHRFEVEPRYIPQLTEHGLRFSGCHPDHPIMQILELSAATHPYFLAAQFHPELTSRPMHPQPMFMGLVAAAITGRCGAMPPTAIAERWLCRDHAPQPS